MFPNTNNNALIKSLTKYSLVNAIFAQPPIIRPDLDESIVDLCHSVSTQVFPARRAAVAVIKRYFNFSTIFFFFESMANVCRCHWRRCAFHLVLGVMVLLNSFFGDTLY